jgi:DNA polymerase-3 subunit gamma/tau
MSLYLKYRPTDLNQVKGNSDVLKTLGSLLEKGKDCPHTFLLHGPTGCGKTTIARIIATKLNCIGQDLYELDSAHFRGIDTVREVRKMSKLKAIEGATRVWIIDECHKMTNDAQNALLKILEDTPAHVYFVLCTTEPQKLLSTIKGRCSQFQVVPLPETQMKGLLKKIARDEGETLTEEVLNVIVESSTGHPRNAIQILEQVLNGDPTRRQETAFKAAEQLSATIELCRALMGRSPWTKIAAILNGLKDQEAESIRRAVLGYCQAILLKGDNILAASILEVFIEPFYDSGFPQLVFACYTITKDL